MAYSYYSNCVSWDSRDVDSEGGLSDMIDSAVNITRSTFLKHVDRSSLCSLEQNLGYERFARRGLTMANDWAVSYYRSKLHGKRVYYFTHSCIEYVFVSEMPKIIENSY